MTIARWHCPQASTRARAQRPSLGGKGHHLDGKGPHQPLQDTSVEAVPTGGRRASAGPPAIGLRVKKACFPGFLGWFQDRGHALTAVALDHIVKQIFTRALLITSRFK